MIEKTKEKIQKKFYAVIEGKALYEHNISFRDITDVLL